MGLRRIFGSGHSLFSELVAVRSELRITVDFFDVSNMEGGAALRKGLSLSETMAPLRNLFFFEVIGNQTSYDLAHEHDLIDNTLSIDSSSVDACTQTEGIWADAALNGYDLRSVAANANESCAPSSCHVSAQTSLPPIDSIAFQVSQWSMLFGKFIHKFWLLLAGVRCWRS